MLKYYGQGMFKGKHIVGGMAFHKHIHHENKPI